MSEPGWPLAPRAARVFYNVADALLGDGERDLDVVAALARQLATRERRRLARRLLLLEWSPRLALRSLRGFSWLSRDERRAWLAQLAARGPQRVQRAVGDLERLVREAAASPAQSLPGA